jgi:pyruvate dehydrogenase E2 component (dihydrolipoyllysine-residue acetyltransferase)
VQVATVLRYSVNKNVQYCIFVPSNRSKMAEIIRMPRLSDTMEEGVIVAWLKKVGEKVQPGDILAEVETDKATMDLESFYDGYLLHIGVAEGAVPVDGVLAVIGEKDEDFAAALNEALSASTAAGSGAQNSDADETESTILPQSEPTTIVAGNNDTADSRIKASPLAKAMAADAGIDLSSLAGTGDLGRIVKRDVEEAVSRGTAVVTDLTPAAALYGEVTVSQMRKTIARRLAESKFSAPHFYLTIEINMSQAVEDRKMLNDGAEVRVSFNDFIVKACALALKLHPNVNSSWHGITMRRHENVNIGVAVAVEDGLLVPVIRDANNKGLRQIHGEVVELAGRARVKKLQAEEMQGNTFTISNLGMFGIEEFTAIINPPDACILAVGAIKEKAIAQNGQIQIAHMMKVTMSCDHRVVDGATGAQFLQTVQNLLEHPVKMLN